MKSYVYPAATSTARALIRYIIDMMNREPERIFYLAFSGGTTPSLMFDIWAHEFREETPWMRRKPNPNNVSPLALDYGNHHEWGIHIHRACLPLAAANAA